MLSQHDLDILYSEYMNKACQAAISKLQRLISSGNKSDTFEAIDILKRIQKDGVDIKNILIQLLPFANLIFCTFVRLVSRDFINTLDVYDILFNSLQENEIIKLLDSKVIEPDHAIKINSIDSMSSILYLIIQNCKYNKKIIEYLLNKYNDIISDEGIFLHMIMYNIPNDVILYIKSCIKNDKFDEQHVNVPQILKYYRQADTKFNNNTIFKSRIHNVIQMIIDIKMEKGYNFPTQNEFVENFKKYYNISDPKQLHFFMNILPYDIHLYLTTEFMIQYTKKIFPIESNNWS